MGLPAPPRLSLVVFSIWLPSVSQEVLEVMAVMVVEVVAVLVVQVAVVLVGDTVVMVADDPSDFGGSARIATTFAGMSSVVKG